MIDIKKRAIALVGQVDEAELTLRMIEAIGGMKRPPGKTNAEIIAHTEPDVIKHGRLAARSALAYIAECLANAERPQ